MKLVFSMSEFFIVRNKNNATVRKIKNGLKITIPLTLGINLTAEHSLFILFTCVKN